MNQRLDHARVAAMARALVPLPLIAERLKCSERQIRRILAAASIPAGYEPNPAYGTDDEDLIWIAFHALGDSIATIAYKVGYSRQHVHTIVHQQELAL